MQNPREPAKRLCVRAGRPLLVASALLFHAWGAAAQAPAPDPAAPPDVAAEPVASPLPAPKPAASASPAPSASPASSLDLQDPPSTRLSLERAPDHAARIERRWYGWQTIMADLGSLVLMVAGADTPGDTLLSLGLAGLFLASPIVHWAHGNVGEGFGSLGLRVAGGLLFVVGLAACIGGTLLDSHDDQPGGCVLAGLSLLLFPAATVMDAILA